jgi:hypothetical protein
MLQTAIKFHMCICALSIIHAQESREGEDESCDKNLIATRNVAGSGGRKSVSEEVKFQDQEGQDGQKAMWHTEDDVKACLTESFADVAHGLLSIKNLQPEYRLKAPDVNDDWTMVSDEKECADLMRRNKNASAYWFDNRALNHDGQPVRYYSNCFLYSKAIYKFAGVDRCVGLKIHDLCVSVDGVDQQPQWLENMEKMFNVYAWPEDQSQEQSEKDCAEKMMKKLADPEFLKKGQNFDFEGPRHTHYKFDPQAKSGEDNCFVGDGEAYSMDRLLPDNFDMSEMCFGRPQADSQLKTP